MKMFLNLIYACGVKNIGFSHVLLSSSSKCQIIFNIILRKKVN